jgi:hypothetical protein
VTVAFMLSGGAIQVGMLRALADHGIGPDLVVGTSVGAVNGAFVASRDFDAEAVDELADVWVGLRRGQVFPLEPVIVNNTPISHALIVPPPCLLRVQPTGFGHAAELMAQGEATARAVLDSRTRRVVPLAAHRRRARARERRHRELPPAG